jgi:hypothetical protein
MSKKDQLSRRERQIVDMVLERAAAVTALLGKDGEQLDDDELEELSRLVEKAKRQRE